MEIKFDENIVLIALCLLPLLLAVPYAIVYWRLFELAGRRGWMCLVPFYSIYIVGKIAKKPKLAALEIFASFLWLVVFVLWIWETSNYTTADTRTLYLIPYIFLLCTWIIVDLRLEKYFLSKYSPSKLVTRSKLNLNPYLILKNIRKIKYNK